MTDDPNTGLAVGTPAPDANVTATDTVDETMEAQDVSDSSPDAFDAGDSSQPKKGVGKRIDELTRNWRQTERDRDYWRELALQSSRQAPEPQYQPAPEPVAPDPVKTLADFNYDDAQYATYIRQSAAEDARRAALDVVRSIREAEQAQRMDQTFKSRVEAFKKAAPDFDDLVLRNHSLPITDDMAAIIRDSDDGPAVAYFLGKNPNAAAAIAQLPPREAARELGKLEARFAFEREQTKKVAPKPAVSNAPPPPSKLDAVEPEITKSPDEMSMGEWLKWREKQVRRNATRR